jgi:hypothetical protein
MHIPGRTEEYERTCDDCGTSWRVPRQFAKHVKSLLTNRGTGPYVDPVAAQAYDKRMEGVEAYRICPKCSSVPASPGPG